ncbi:MAG: nucleotidyl transferase AbiEii/AbiGii toxin family protein [Victivallales bacterium]|nr:nucleotidyl transferase AbiEii/AbiGii toxin family protein [Victivallales bacterium]
MNNDVIIRMLESYNCIQDQDYANALREIMQNVALLALSRTDFFSHAAFYGGTALRILYGLNRGSEDMDFSLLRTDDAFNLADYSAAIEVEFSSFGLQASFKPKQKTFNTNIQSGFLKANTQIQLLSIGLDKTLAGRFYFGDEIKIKVEVDVCPPPGGSTEIKYVFQPIPFSIRSCTLPTLLAGKLHAVLFRGWKSRVKGRDWYDLTWYAGRHPEYDIRHLESRSRQSGDYSDSKELTSAKVHDLLVAKLDTIDFEEMKKDVRPFLRNPEAIDCWSREFFHEVFGRLIAK